MPDYTTLATVFATTSVVGFHNWPEAPEEVVYLRVPHRHLFGIKVELPVHADRQIEFHILRRQTEAIIHLIAPARRSRLTDGTGDLDFGRMSCESIAQGLIEGLKMYHYPNLPWYRVTIDEDGENGATVELTQITTL